MTRKPSPASLDDRQYELLAAFRYALRGFLHFSEAAAEESGLATQHYQAMLVVRGCPADRRITIGDLAHQLFIRPHSAVGLVDRLHARGLMRREVSIADRRKIHLRLTAKGERVLERLAGVHREELRRIGPDLRRLVGQVTRATQAADAAAPSAARQRVTTGGATGTWKTSRK